MHGAVMERLKKLRNCVDVMMAVTRFWGGIKLIVDARLPKPEGPGTGSVAYEGIKAKGV